MFMPMEANIPSGYAYEGKNKNFMPTVAQISVSTGRFLQEMFMGGHEALIENGTPWSVYAYGGKRKRCLWRQE